MRARLYSGGAGTAVICIPGLTRNAADFDDLAPKIAKTGRNVIVVNLRGRGASDRDGDYRRYHPLTYRDDILKLTEMLGLDGAIFIGTSLGGMVTMLVSQTSPQTVRAALLNDIGPELAPEGLARIAGYVGTAGSAATETIEDAAAVIKAINKVAFPDATDDDWIVFARRTFRQVDNGHWVLDYDPLIARALVETGPAPDLWPGFESLKETPTLVVRGALSDLLSLEIIEKMRGVHPDFDYAEVPGVGHAPMLTEPAALNAIKSFLARIDWGRID